jgi:hypothetical protein
LRVAAQTLPQLYRLPKYRRMLSLRFLAYHVLGHLMQVDTHDSNEDAGTALYLYRKCDSCCCSSSRQTLPFIYCRDTFPLQHLLIQPLLQVPAAGGVRA